MFYYSSNLVHPKFPISNIVNYQYLPAHTVIIIVLRIDCGVGEIMSKFERNAVVNFENVFQFQVSKRDITIVDQSGTAINATLWGKEVLFESKKF